MSTVRVPQGAAGKVITLPAPGRQTDSAHVSAGPFKEFMIWAMRVRTLQLADGYSYDDALAKAGEEARNRKHRPPGRAQQQGSLR